MNRKQRTKHLLLDFATTGYRQFMMRWYVVQTRPGKERLAERHLRNQGFATFIPLQRRARKRGKRLQWLASPFFPNYLFVEIDIARQRWRSVNGTVGVIRLVGFGDPGASGPSPMPEGLVERFRALSDKEGLVRFKESLAAGDHVRIIGGPFDSLCGVLETAGSNERVTILLELLSGATRVRIARGQLIAA